MIFKSTYSLFFFPILVWLIAYFGFSFDGLYGQDAYEYLRYTEALKSFLETGKPPGDYFWGVYYPIFGSVLSFMIPKMVLALQLISVLSLSLGAIYLDKIVRLVYNKDSTNNIPFLFFTLSPFILIHSILVMSDMFACCLTIVAIYHLLVFVKKATGKSLLLGTIFVMFAMLTRYATVVILFPFCFLALVHVVKKRNFIYVLLSLIAAGLIAIPHIAIRSQNSLQFLSHEWLSSWNILNLFRSNFTTIDGEMHYNCINVIYAFFTFFHPAFFIFGILLLLFFIKRRTIQFPKRQRLFLIAIILYSVFLAGIPFQNKRFLILAFPLIIVFLFPIIKQLFESLKRPKLVLIIIVFIQVSLGIFYAKTFFERNILERTIAQEIEKYQGSTIYAFDIDIALKGRKLDFKYKSLWKEKLPDFETNALLLVNGKQLEKQWKGKNPLVNWQNAKQNYQLEKLKSFSGDFNLYRIGERK